MAVRFSTTAKQPASCRGRESAGSHCQRWRRLESDYVISNIHPKRTLEILDKNRSIKNAFISRIRSLDNTYGIFTLYLVMKKKSTPYQNRNIYLHGNNKVWYDKLLYPGRTTNCMISMQASSEDSQYASVISILTPMYMDELSAWKDSSPEHRGEGYQFFKKEKAEQILRFLRKTRFRFLWKHRGTIHHYSVELSWLHRYGRRFRIRNHQRL